MVAGPQRRYAQATMRLILLAVPALLVLSGCTAPASPTSPNVTVCDEFDTAADRLATLMSHAVSGNLTDDEDAELSAMSATLDRIGLRAEGEVGDRIETVSTLIDNPIAVLFDPSDYYDAADAVVRACDAEGVTVDPRRWN